MLRHRMENSRHGRDRPAPLPAAAHRTAPGAPPATPPVPSTGRALLRVARDVAQYCCVAGPLLDGLGVTLQVVAASLALALLAGLLAALLRQSGSRVGRALAVGYVETVRNTPLLIQLFVVYFVLAPVLGMGRFAAGVLALSLFEGAYIAEILRAGILSVPTGQWEASRSLGMDVPGTYMEVVLPQAARTALPPLTGQLVSLVKDSSLVSTIALHDLAMQAQAVAADTFLVFEVWFLVAGMYLALTLALSALAQLLERRLRYEF